MRVINYYQVVDAVRQMCIDSAYELPEDVLGALQKAEAKETNSRAKRILGQLVDNARIAKDDRIPLCQDTGIAVVFVQQGNQVRVVDETRAEKTIIDAIHEGVAAGYQQGELRKSVVVEPLKARTNTQTNTPAVIHHTVVAGDTIDMTVMSKGGGCENKSQFKMFNPTDSQETVCQWIVEVVKSAGANACPPFVVGVGIGGDFEQCCTISKQALLRNIGVGHPDEFYATLEADLLEAINATGLGTQGLGGDTTALSVQIETAPCHIASLPVAVNIECHSHRHKAVRI